MYLHLQVKPDFWLGHRLRIPHAVPPWWGWEEKQRLCAIAGTSWKLKPVKSKAQWLRHWFPRIPKSSVVVDWINTFVFAYLLDWLKDWQARTTVLNAAGEVRRKRFWSLRSLFPCKSKWEQSTTLPFPAPTLCWFIKGRCYLILPLEFS